jgi:hypothetical protein
MAPTTVGQYEGSAIYVDPRDRSVWWIGICNSCKDAVLVHGAGQEVWHISPDPLPSPTDERIPDPMRGDLAEAKTCYSVHAFRGCAVIARRAIQSACIDRGANRSNRLETQLDELSSKGVITKELASWGHSVRWIANDAAHPDSLKVEEKDADDILKLAEEFLRVIYVTPMIAKEQADKRGPARQDERKNERKQEHH